METILRSASGKEVIIAPDRPTVVIGERVADEAGVEHLVDRARRDPELGGELLHRDVRRRQSLIADRGDREVAGRVADFLANRLQNYRPQVDVIPARKKGSNFSPDDPEILAPLLHANFIFMGPGSPTYAIRQPDGLSFEIIVEPPIPHGTPEAMTQALNDSLEALVRKHLDQWFWIHRRWK